MNNLTPKETETLQAIQDFISDNGYAPTVRELCQILDIPGTATVQSRLADLSYKGYLKRVKGRPRTLRVVKP